VPLWQVVGDKQDHSAKASVFDSMPTASDIHSSWPFQSAINRVFNSKNISIAFPGHDQS
jgi:hypothetical protein